MNDLASMIAHACARQAAKLLLIVGVVALVIGVGIGWLIG